MKSLKIKSLSEFDKGKLVGGFSYSLSSVSQLNLTDKNKGYCVTTNNCVAGTNCSKACIPTTPRDKTY